MLPEHALFVGQNLRMSVIRSVTAPPHPVRRRPARPLRVLVAGADPEIGRPSAWCRARDRDARRILERGIADGIAQLQVLEQATWEELQRALRTFEPTSCTSSATASCRRASATWYSSTARARCI